MRHGGYVLQLVCGKICCIIDETAYLVLHLPCGLLRAFQVYKERLRGVAVFESIPPICELENLLDLPA